MPVSSPAAPGLTVTFKDSCPVKILSPAGVFVGKEKDLPWAAHGCRALGPPLWAPGLAGGWLGSEPVVIVDGWVIFP